MSHDAERQERQTDREDKQARWMLLLAVGVVAVLAALSLVFDRSDSVSAAPTSETEGKKQIRVKMARGGYEGRPAPPEKLRVYGKSSAWRHCKNAVREELKAPGTAKFKGMFDDPLDDVISLSGGRYQVNSWVDAHNSYGALIRSEFECVIDPTFGSVRVSFD